MQDIYRLQAFVAVVEEGSFTAAVNRLHITQPALSARIKLLEDNLGCTLLERTGKGARPTPLGKLVYGIAVDITKRMRQLENTVKNHLDLREGWVHLSGGAVSVAGVFPDAIQRFSQLYPHIQFTLHEQDSHGVIQAIQDGAVDVGVVTLEPGTEATDDIYRDLHVHTAVVDHLAIIASPAHPIVKVSQALANQKKQLLPLHLNHQPMILFEEGSAIRRIIDAAFTQAYVKPRIVMTLRSTQSMLRMVEKNIGLSVVSSLVLKDVEHIQTIAVQNISMQRTLMVVSHKERTLPPAAARFATVLCEVLGASEAIVR